MTKSPSQKSLRGIRSNITAAFQQNTTTPNTSILTTTVPAGALKAGDIIRIEIGGNITGTNGTKTIRIVDDTGALLTYSLLASETGGYFVSAKIFVESSTRYAFMSTNSGTTAARRIRRTTGVDLDSSGMTLRIEGWIANAGDNMTVDYLNVTPERFGFAI